MADLNRRERQLADVIEQCWGELQELTGTLVQESLEENPFATAATGQDPSNYDLRVGVIVASYQSQFAEIMLDQYDDSGSYSMREFTQQLSQEYKRFNKAESDISSSRAVLELKFDRTSPTAKKYAQEQSAAMVSFISNSEREAVRDLIGRAFAEQRTYQQTGRALAALLAETVPQGDVAARLGSVYGVNANGLFPRYANAVANYAERQAAHLAMDGVTGSKALKIVQEKSNRYATKLRRSRAKMIARTEIMQANNSGRLAAAQQAAKKGLFDPSRAKRQWISAPQDSCYICNPLNGVVVDFNKTWSEGEPAFVHPNCRCTWLLLPNVPSYGVPSVTGDGTAGNPFMWTMPPRNSSLAPLSTGGATSSGVPESMPEPVPIQSTTVTDEVAEIADDVKPVDVPPVDEITPENMEDFVDSFIWNDQGDTWDMLQPDERDYLIDLMIDTEIQKSVTVIADDLSTFAGDQGYKLMADAPKEVAEELLRLQQEAQEALVQVDVSRRIRSLQVKRIADPESSSGAALADNLFLSGRKVMSQGQTILTAADDLPLKERLILEAKMLDAERVNRRVARLAEQYSDAHVALTDDALIKMQAVGDAIEKEVQRRVDEIVGVVDDVGMSPTEIAAIQEKRKYIYDQVLEGSGVGHTRLKEGGTFEFIDHGLSSRAEMRFNLSTTRDDLGTLIRSLDLEEIRVPNEAIEALGLTSISESLPLKTVLKNIEMTSGRHAGTKSGRNILARWQGDLDQVIFGGERVLDDFIIDATQVTGDELVETLDVLQQLIAAHNAVPGGFLDEAWLSMYDDVIENTLAKALVKKEDKLVSWGVNRIDRQGLLDDIPSMPDDFAQDIRNMRLTKVDEVQDAVRHISDDLADEQALLADLSDDLVVPVRDSQVELLEELVDDWIAQEAELPSNAMFKRPNSNRVELTTEWLDDMKARTTQLKADIAEELADLTPGTGPYTNAVARHKQELKTLMDEFSDAYVAEAALKQQVLSRELLGQSADTLREIPGRRWSTRGDGPMSFSKLQRNFFQIKDDMKKASWGDPKGLPKVRTARADWMNRIEELVGPVDGPKWKELQSKYPSLFEEITEAEELARVALQRSGAGVHPNKAVQLFEEMAEAVMEGDIKVSDAAFKELITRPQASLGVGERAYTADLVISANSKQKSSIANLLENARRENMAIDASPVNDIDVNLIRRAVVADSRQLGGELEFELGLMNGSNVKAGKLGPKCGKNLEKALPHPVTGELVYDMSVQEYAALAQQYKDESISIFPSRWVERTARNADIDGSVTVSNGKAVRVQGAQSGVDYRRSGLYLVSDSHPDAKTRAYHLALNRHVEGGSMRSTLTFLDQMEDVTGTIFMVSDDVPSRGAAINITFNSLNQSTMTHELMHLMQNQSGVFGDLELAWYRRRMAMPAPTEENPLAWRAKPGKQYQTTRMSSVAGWGADELTVPDDLMTAYAGKTYDKELNWTGLKNPKLPSDKNEPLFNWGDGYSSNRRPSEAVTMGTEGAFTIKTETGYDPSDVLEIAEYFDPDTGRKLAGVSRKGAGVSTGEADTDYLSFISGAFGAI
jgi:hypothetical protein